MRMEWDEGPHERTWAIPDDFEAAAEQGSQRLDAILPADEETSAATPEALETYLNAMILMVSRHAQPLALISIAVDETPLMRFLGSEGCMLIGRAVARCIRQESRIHDVVARARVSETALTPTFLIACPLLSEEQAAALGERMRDGMSAYAEDPDRPWLTLSVGIANLTLDIADSSSLIARATDSLRRARRAGGSRVWRHSDTLRQIRDVQDDDRIDEDRTEDTP